MSKWNDPAGAWNETEWGRPVSGVPFTQYLLPDGRRKPVWIDRPTEIEDKAKALIEKGVVFDAEMLRTGQVSFTAEHNDEVIAIEVCDNGPPVPPAVDKIIEKAYERLCS